MKLDYKRTIIIGFAFMSILAFWQFYDQVMPSVLEYRFELGPFKTNVIMAIDNVLAIFMLPLFGVLSDKTNTRLGKRTPYILFGTLAAAGLLCLLAFFERRLIFPGFMATLMALLVVMSIYRSPAVAYMPDVTEKPLRSKANAVINLVGYVGGIFATVVMMIFLTGTPTEDGTVYSSDQDLTAVFIIIAAFMLAAVAAMTLLLRENRLPHVTDEEPAETKSENKKLPKDVRKSFVFILLSVFLWFAAYNAVTTAFSRYCINKWGVAVGKSSSYLLVATLSAIAAFVPLGFLSSRIGRKKTVLIGIAVMATGFAAAAFIGRDTSLAFRYAVFAVVGVAWAAINVNSYPMVVEMGSGADIGKYTGLYYAFSMAAQIATPLLSGFIIERSSFGYAVLFPYAVIFSAASFVTMCFVRHGDNKPDLESALIENLSGGED